MRSRKARTELTNQPSFPPYTPYPIHPTQYQPQPHVQYTPYLYQQPITPRAPYPAYPIEPALPLEPPISPIIPSLDTARELSDYFNQLQKQPRWSTVESAAELNYVINTLNDHDYDLEALRNGKELSNTIWEDLGLKLGTLTKLRRDLKVYRKLIKR